MPIRHTGRLAVSRRRASLVRWRRRTTRPAASIPTRWTSYLARSIPSTAMRAGVLLRDGFLVDGMLLVLLQWFFELRLMAERASTTEVEVEWGQTIP